MIITRKRLSSLGTRSRCCRCIEGDLGNRLAMVKGNARHGGGKWYTLEIDYNQVAKTLKAVNYHGYISLEFEGQEAFETAVPKSLKLLQEAFA